MRELCSFFSNDISKWFLDFISSPLFYWLCMGVHILIYMAMSTRILGVCEISHGHVNWSAGYLWNQPGPCQLECSMCWKDAVSWSFETLMLGSTFLWDWSIPCCREAPKTEGKQLQIASGSLWNWIDSLGPALPEREYKQKRQLRVILRQAKLQGRLWARPTAWGKQKQGWLPQRGLDKLSHLEGTLSNLMNCLRAVQGAPGSQLLWAITHAGVGFHDTIASHSYK